MSIEEMNEHNDWDKFPELEQRENNVHQSL